VIDTGLGDTAPSDAPAADAQSIDATPDAGPGLQIASQALADGTIGTPYAAAITASAWDAI
jgi:hypothetical protein